MKCKCENCLVILKDEINELIKKIFNLSLECG